MTILQSTIRIIITVLTLIYTEGYHISKHYNVCIDPAFTTREHTLIIEGMSIWNTNRIRLEEAEPCNITIVDATSWHDRWTQEEHVGYTDFYSNEVVLFPDRCTSDAMFRWVAAHEAGHTLGLLHVDPMKFPAIMDSVVREDVMDDLKLYPKDREQLCQLWKECQ